MNKAALATALALTLASSAFASLKTARASLEATAKCKPILAELQTLAKTNLEAKFLLATCLTGGYGVPANLEQAAALIQTSAAGGWAESQNTLGQLYFDGSPALKIARDDKQALEWFRKAAQQKYPEAQFNVGAMYGNGYGVPQNQEEAFRFYALAAGQGNSKAQNMLGTAYQEGKGVAKDPLQAVT